MVTVDGKETEIIPISEELKEACIDHAIRQASQDRNRKNELSDVLGNLATGRWILVKEK